MAANIAGGQPARANTGQGIGARPSRRHSLRTARCFLLALVIALPAGGARAGSWNVNSPLDIGEADPGNGLCDTVYNPHANPPVPPNNPNVCTLRAAIQEVNGATGASTIGILNQLAPLIRITSALPSVTNPVTIAPTGTAMVTVQWAGTGTSPDGLVLGAAGSKVEDLSVIGFKDGAGIRAMIGGNVTIIGNRLGLDTNGNAVPNNVGLELDNSSNGTVGGTTPASRNIVSGNRVYGIYLSGASNTNTIAGNWVGTDQTGAALLNSNPQVGIRIEGSDNTIGGMTNAAGNVVSGNEGGGVYIKGGTGNKIFGNFIGVDLTGGKKLRNKVYGVFIDGGPTNIIGQPQAAATTTGTGRKCGTTPGAWAAPGNVISGNDGYGITIQNAGADGNKIFGNFIGTDVKGTTGIGNASNGIYVSSVSRTEIGDVVDNAGNLVSDNGATGIGVYGDKVSKADTTLIQGNLIGTKVDGLAGLGNHQSGVMLDGAINTWLGGTSYVFCNLISANGTSGQYEGVWINGTPPPAPPPGIVLPPPQPKNATGNKVQGNIIGLDIDGAKPLGNTGNGVFIKDAPGNLVGGANDPAAAPTTMPRNIISANGRSGVMVLDTGTSLAGAGLNKIQGNFIGTDITGKKAASGTATLGNAIEGVFISGASNTTVGGADEKLRNIIAGNGQNGVVISSATAQNNFVQGNYIGTDVDGTAALANGAAGVFISDAPNNTVGGSAITPGTPPAPAKPAPGTPPGNLISGNLGTMSGTGFGGAVHIQGANAKTNRVQGNLIGTQKDGKTALGNKYDGVYIVQNASGNIVGGSTADLGNVIAFNGWNGVNVETGTGNAILSNAIFKNTRLGIDLGNDGITFNDSKGHAGANNYQDYPLIMTPKAGPNGGRLYGKPAATYIVQTFANSTPSATGFGQGETLLATELVTADGDGMAQFTVPATPAGQTLTATATDSANNTSEFSCAPLTKLKLGGTIPNVTQSGCYKVYVPSRWGGILSVTSAPTVPTMPQQFFVVDLHDGKGKPYVNGTDSGFSDDHHGWYTFAVVGVGVANVANTFIEAGEASIHPWNFYYYPKLDGGGTHLFGAGGAMEKYDTKFHSSAEAWEIANHKITTALGWWGHCWGGSVASIILEQPAAVGTFTEDEVEGLATEFFEATGGDLLAPTHGLFTADTATGTDNDDYPLVIPNAAVVSAADRDVHTFHDALRKTLRVMKFPVQTDLRQTSGTGTAEVWNQGCYSYSSKLEEDPAAAGDEDTEKILQIKHTTDFNCNDDFGPPSQKDATDPLLHRTQRSEYVLLYAPIDGEINPNVTIAGRSQKWQSMRLLHDSTGDIDPGATPPGRDIYIPSRVYNVRSAAAHFVNAVTTVPPGFDSNPKITGNNLTTLGLKKNPGL